MAIMKVEFSMQSNCYFLGSQTKMDLIIECLMAIVKIEFLMQSNYVFLGGQVTFC